MSASPAPATNGEAYFSFRRHGEVAVVHVSAAIENLQSNVIETAAQVVLSPLKANPPSNVIVDLSEVQFFTSEFISFLLRCHVIVKKHHGELVLAGVSDRIRELLRQTALDTLWAIYRTRQEALDSLGGAD
jgi:anti-sigma B factor antagonist